MALKYCATRHLGLLHPAGSTPSCMCSNTHPISATTTHLRPPAAPPRTAGSTHGRTCPPPDPPAHPYTQDTVPADAACVCVQGGVGVGVGVGAGARVRLYVHVCVRVCVCARVCCTLQRCAWRHMHAAHAAPVGAGAWRACYTRRGGCVAQQLHDACALGRRPWMGGWLAG